MNSTDADMSFGTAQASKVVARVAGPGLEEHCKSRMQKSGKLNESEVFVTPGYNLPSSHILHVICPAKSKVSQQICEDVSYTKPAPCLETWRNSSSMP